jgi:hypothetical protein
MVTPHRGAGGSVVLFGWCRAVEGKAKEACGSLTMEAEREKEREAGADTGVPHGEQERGAGMCGMEGGQPAGRAAGGGGWWQRDAVVQSRGRGGVGR